MPDSRLVFVVWMFTFTAALPADEPQNLTSTWGSDHVGKPLPEYVTGDECLFCHRDIGPTWPENRHGLNLRRVHATSDEMSSLRRSQLPADLNSQIQFVLGSSNQTRFLKRSKAYGKLDLLSVKDELTSHRLSNVNNASWDPNVFAAKCAGCHTTAVDAKSRTFAAIGIDCYSCHGDVSLQHTKDTSLVYLSKINRAPKQVVSICGQCHLRGAISRASGLPYAYNFVAGDNLLRDFEVELSDERLRRLDVIDQHIFKNVRDIESGKTSESCVSCHDVHPSSTDKHTELPESNSCTTCHTRGQLNPKLTIKTRHNQVCGY